MEPHATEVILLFVGVLLLLAVLASRFASRSGIPVVLLFVLLGILAGDEGLGGIRFESYALSYRLGTFALVLILFDGGLRTPLFVVRRALAPATLLATVGVALTAIVVGAGAQALGFGWTEGLLLGAIVSSTDAAAVFSMLRGSGVRLKEHVGAVVELESGLNDPVAVILTVAFTREVAEGRAIGPSLVTLILAQIAVGGAIGVAIGFVGRAILSRFLLRASAVYPILTTALAFVAYGAASLAFGSGFLAVYVAGVVLGNGRLPYRSVLLRMHDFLAWTSQIAMFVVLGLLVSPSRLLAIAPIAVSLAALLALFARPAAVFVCVVPFGYAPREALFVSWVGLRGAVPIILATMPILAGVHGAHEIFDVVFFVVLVSAILQGGTATRLARALDLAEPEPPAPEALLEIASRRPIDDELLSFEIRPGAAVCDARIADIPFPDHSSAMLVVRGADLVAPRGDTVLTAGDHVYVFCKREDAPTLRLLFGRTEEQ